MFCKKKKKTWKCRLETLVLNAIRDKDSKFLINFTWFCAENMLVVLMPAEEPWWGAANPWTKFRKSFILSTKKWIKCFPEKNPVNSRGKSGKIMASHWHCRLHEYFFCPLLEKFWPRFKHIAQLGTVGVPIAQTVLHFAHFQVKAGKRGVLGQGWGCFVCVHIP